MNAALRTAWLGRSFEYYDELGSTNIYLKENALALGHGAAVMAGRQTKGKGRLGREWVQSDRTNLALSLLLHGQNVQNLPFLPLIAGISVASALEKLTGVNFPLKWSNDVLFDSKKLCGILCESRILGDGAFAVVGIGVNLTQSREDLNGLGLVYATSLKLATGKIFEDLLLAAEICNQFEPLLEEFQKNGFIRLREDYKKRCVTLGKEVRIIDANTERTGIAVDVAADGGLCCEIDGELVIVHAGEASVRGIYGYM